MIQGITTTTGNNNQGSDNDMLVSPTQRVAAEKEALQPAFNLSDIGTIQDHLVTNDERIMYNCSAVSRRGRLRSSPVGITAGSSMEAPKLPAENSTLDPKEDALENYKTYTEHTKNDPQPQPEAKKKNKDAVKAVEHMQPPPQYSQETNVSSQTVKQLRVEAAEDRSIIKEGATKKTRAVEYASSETGKTSNEYELEALRKLRTSCDEIEAIRKLPGSEERLKTIKIINEAIAELIREKALAGKRRRRKLTGWNIFTKRRSLENMLGRDFDDDEEFVAYVIDNKVFKYQSGKERRRKLNQLKKKNKTSVVGKMCLQKTGDEFNNLAPERSKFYDSLAEWLTKNRDEEMD